MKLVLLLGVSLVFVDIAAKPAPAVQKPEQEDCYEQCEDCLSLGLCAVFNASTAMVLNAFAHKAILREDEASACFLGGLGVLSSIVGKIELQNRNMARADARTKLLEKDKKTKSE